jgi:hypothetical protein
MSSSLPPPWIAAIDPSSGQTYYVNTETRETSWSPPPPPPSHEVPPFVLPQQTLQPTTYPPSSHEVQPLLVAQARSLVDQLEKKDFSSSSPERLEIETLSPGQIADLYYLQREARSEDPSSNNHGAPPYEPIEPYKLLLTAERPPAEPTRLDTRLRALYKELERT